MATQNQWANNSSVMGALRALGHSRSFSSKLNCAIGLRPTWENGLSQPRRGIFDVLRSDEQRHLFLSSRYRRRMKAPSPRLSDLLFEKHRLLFLISADWASTSTITYGFS